MNLAGVLRAFRELSGRYDLLDDDASETIKVFINQASRNLDRLTEHQKSFGSYFNLISANSFHFTIPICRAVKEVIISDSSSERSRLDKVDIQYIVQNYLNKDIESGTPLYYSPVITRKVPDNANLSSFSSYMQYVDTVTNSTDSYNAIIIVPPPSSQMLVEVRGLFYSKELSKLDDENYWTVNHPLTLLKAVMRELEIFNQNKSKTEAWEAALAVDIEQINKDLVEEHIADIDEMAG